MDRLSAQWQWLSGHVRRSVLRAPLAAGAGARFRDPVVPDGLGRWTVAHGVCVRRGARNQDAVPEVGQAVLPRGAEAAPRAQKGGVGGARGKKTAGELAAGHGLHLLQGGARVRSDGKRGAREAGRAEPAQGRQLEGRQAVWRGVPRRRGADRPAVGGVPQVCRGQPAAPRRVSGGPPDGGRGGVDGAAAVQRAGVGLRHHHFRRHGVAAAGVSRGERKGARRAGPEGVRDHRAQDGPRGRAQGGAVLQHEAAPRGAGRELHGRPGAGAAPDQQKHVFADRLGAELPARRDRQHCGAVPAGRPVRHPAARGLLSGLVRDCVLREGVREGARPVRLSTPGRHVDQLRHAQVRLCAERLVHHHVPLQRVQEVPVLCLHGVGGGALRFPHAGRLAARRAHRGRLGHDGVHGRRRLHQGVPGHHTDGVQTQTDDRGRHPRAPGHRQTAALGGGIPLRHAQRPQARRHARQKGVASDRAPEPARAAPGRHKAHRARHRHPAGRPQGRRQAASARDKRHPLRHGAAVRRGQQSPDRLGGRPADWLFPGHPLPDGADAVDASCTPYLTIPP
ncbi:hypothetical protein KL923_000083 [Ogataea haglerorum]|nr:hypothetical protein KL923_000083 [Ogataea haglerorum]KAG7814997.1 hypothetical protein KL924_000083 [Ogataea haglerorum]